MPASSIIYAFGPFLDAIRPSKSPHLVASTIGVVSIIWLSLKDDNILSDARFWCVSICILFALIGAVYFSFKDTIDEQDEIENHFKFARAMGIGSAVLALTLSGILIELSVCYFIGYSFSAIQLLTFIAYSAIRLFKPEKKEKLKIFEISFIMFVFLIGCVYCLSQITSDIEITPRIFFPPIIFGFFWLIYELFWIWRIFQLVELRLCSVDETD